MDIIKDEYITVLQSVSIIDRGQFLDGLNYEFIEGTRTHHPIPSDSFGIVSR